MWQVAFDRYFVERVFERQSPGVRKLMLKLALLDRFNIGMCQLLSDENTVTQQLVSYIKKQYVYIAHRCIRLFIRILFKTSQ